MHSYLSAVQVQQKCTVCVLVIADSYCSVYTVMVTVQILMFGLLQDVCSISDCTAGTWKCWDKLQQRFPHSKTRKKAHTNQYMLTNSYCYSYRPATFVLCCLDHGRSTFLWQTVTCVIASWFVGHTWKNDSRSHT